ncbi:hypothetical protein ACFV61_11710, partial [Kitasatospora sp. NPDC059817]
TPPRSGRERAPPAPGWGVGGRYPSPRGPPRPAGAGRAAPPLDRTVGNLDAFLAKVLADTAR